MNIRNCKTTNDRQNLRPKCLRVDLDILDYTADAEAMGKNVGDDLAEGKPTLPLINAIERSTGAEKEGACGLLFEMHENRGSRLPIRWPHCQIMHLLFRGRDDDHFHQLHHHVVMLPYG